MPADPTPRDRLLSWLAGPNCRPLGKSELARAFGVPSGERAALRRAVDALVAEGLLEPRKGGRFGPPGGKPDLARGIFETSFRGRHSVRLLVGGRAIQAGADGIRRVEVAAGGAGTAISGDLVDIRLKRAHREEGGAWGRRPAGRGAAETPAWEARVTGIVEEGRRVSTGIFRRRGKYKTVEVDDKRFPELLDVVEIAGGLEPGDGDLVVARVIHWDQARRPPLARVIKIIGDPSAPGNDMLAVMSRFDLPAGFPDAVTREAEAMPLDIAGADLRERDDWRDRLVVTVDPFDARDFDDAVHVSKTEHGWLLAVHIADVSHYVKPGSDLDAEARKRGNSVYLVDRVIPMLPEKISNGLCSLVPGEDRLTRLALMEFDGHGRLLKATFSSAIIRSQRRYAYEEAFAVLQRGGEECSVAADAMLHEAWRLASRLRQRRFKSGALDLDFPEVKVILDARGQPVELRKVEHDISHQMIEEFMLAANEAVAATVRRAGLPCVYRVHDEPDEGKLREFLELARSHGFRALEGDGRHALQALLGRIRGTPEEHALKLSLLKSMKRAVYSAEPRGHYGLAKDNYLHFTSPIRRYADLVAHRVLGKWHGHRPVIPARLPDQAALEETAADISRAERVAADAEMESRRLKEMEYFERLLESDDPRVFPALVTDARRAGLFIELVDVQITGLVPPAGFPHGDWWFDGSTARWQQARTHVELRAGSTCTVRIARVDKENRFLDFRIVR